MNQMSKKEVKIPIAAVFSTLNVLIGLINIFVTYTTYTRIIGIPMSEVHRAVAWSVLSLVPSILLTIVLFMRKRGMLLWITLGLELGIWLYSLCTFAFHFEFFLSVYNAYKQGKEITAKRMYLETMEGVLTNSKKVILDPSAKGGNVLPILPLNRNTQAQESK